MLDTAELILSDLLLENQTTGLLWLDGTLHLRYLNPAAETLLNLDGQSTIGKAVTDFFAQDDAFTSILQRAMATRETVTRRELELMLGRPEIPQTVTADCTVTPVVERQGVLGLLVELVPLDRHLRISREQALTAQSDANRILARNLAHEIKNPLGGVRGAAQLLARRLQDAKLIEYTRVIVMEADRLAALADTLLGPPQAPRRITVNLHELVEHVVHLTETPLTPALKIIRDYDPSLPELQLDRDQIIQAMLNLAKNAREAVAEHGCITFRTRVLRQFTLNGTRHRLVARVDIADNGPGIAAEALPRLFSPLVSSKPHGAGLGLSIAQELVSRHGGLIECTSTAGNTVFSILLPMGNQYEQQAT